MDDPEDQQIGPGQSGGWGKRIAFGAAVYVLLGFATAFIFDDGPPWMLPLVLAVSVAVTWWTDRSGRLVSLRLGRLWTFIAIGFAVILAGGFVLFWLVSRIPDL